MATPGTSRVVPQAQAELARCLFDKELWTENGGNVGKRRQILRCISKSYDADLQQLCI